MPRPLPESLTEDRAKASSFTEEEANATPVKIVAIDVPFGDVAALALKFGIVWFILGVLGALLVLAIS